MFMLNYALMSETLDISPDELADVMIKLENTFTEAREISQEIQEYEKSLSEYLPADEIAMLGRRVVEAERRRSRVLSRHAVLSMRSFILNENLVADAPDISSSDSDVADNQETNSATAEILVQSSAPEIDSIITTEPETEEIPQLETTIVDIQDPEIKKVKPKSKPPKPKKANKAASSKKSLKPEVKTKQSKDVKSKVKQHPALKVKISKHQVDMEARKRYLESLDAAVDEPIKLKDDRPSPNFHRDLFDYLMGNDNLPAQRPNHKKLGVTIGTFLDTPLEIRPVDWQQRVRDCQLI